MGSLEDLFSRHEREFLTFGSAREIQDWLRGAGTSHERSASRGYANAAGRLFEMAETIQIEQQILSAESEIKSEIKEATKRTTNFQLEQEKLLDNEIEVQRTQELRTIGEGITSEQRIRFEQDIESTLDKIRKEKQRAIEIETNNRIRDILNAKKEFEEIKASAKDKRKRQNARNNIEKLNRRLENL